MAEPKVTIHGQLQENGYPAQGRVAFEDAHFAVDSTQNLVYTPVFTEAFLDQNGEFWVQLPLNVGPQSTPQPRSYTCSLEVSGYAETFDFVLGPTSLTVEFADLIHITNPVSLPSQYVASIGGMTGNISYADFVSVFPSLAPSAGKSAYQLWLDNGHSGSFDDFLTFITGPKGDKGDKGLTGSQGVEGERGPRGPAGPRGTAFRITMIVSSSAVLLAGGSATSVDGQQLQLPADSIVAALADKTLWVFDGVEWRSLGSYQGAQGPAGPVQTLSSLGIPKVQNVAPMEMPVSTLQAAAIAAALSNAGAVKSVNGQIGDVNIGAADVGLDKVANKAPADLGISTATQGQLDALSQQIGTKASLPAGGTTAKYLRGDTTWQALNPSAVGLGNVDNNPSMGLLATGADLNTVVQSGKYYQPTDANALASLNYPAPQSGFLEVVSRPAGQTVMVVQTYVTSGYAGNEARRYVRSIYGTNSWSVWVLQADNAGKDPLSLQSLKIIGGGGISSTGVVYGKSIVPTVAASLASFDSSDVTTAINYPLAPSAASSHTVFPQGYSIWRVEFGVSGSATDYPSSSGMLENHRNRAHPRQIFTGSDGSQWYRIFLTSWAPWQKLWTANNLQLSSGVFAFTGVVANTPQTVSIGFDSIFKFPPVVVATAATAVPERVSVGVSGISTLGFDLYMTRTTATNTTVEWLAVGV